MRLLSIDNNEDVHLLRKPSDEVDFILGDNSGDYYLSKNDQDVISELKKFVLEKQGLGMSAVQLNIHRQIFVMRKPWNSDQLITVINPRIIRSSGKSKKTEGCFSYPVGLAMVQRPKQVWVSYYDERGDFNSEEFLLGVEARVFQHETGHCFGILMSDGKKFLGWGG